VCRLAAGECDVAENCDGNGSCPSDGFKPDGSACGSQASSSCDQPDTCLSGVCQTNQVCEDCAASLRKTHTGDTTPGGEVTYTLQWSNSCRNPVSDLNVTDPIPGGMTVESASSPVATTTISGNTVTFHMDSWGGGDVGQGTITVRIADSTEPGTTIVNTASLTTAGIPSAEATDKLNVRSQADLCPVALRKVHSGNDNPGGTIQYTLQWSNACADDLADVTISDPLPAGLTLVSASSGDASASVSGNTATFTADPFKAGTVGQGFITATIDPTMSSGASVLNVATLSDPAGHYATADNVFHVRDDGTGGATLSCFLRAQIYATPGSFVKYELRYKNGSESNSVNLTMPDDVTIISAYPTPTAQQGQTLFWDSLAATAGKVKVNTQVSPLAPDQTVLPSSATMNDGAGNNAVCEQTSVVTASNKLFASIRSQTYSRAGLTLRYTARYREAVGHNQLTISLPDEVTVLRSQPAPSGGSERTLTFSDLMDPSGSVKIDAQIAADVATGTVLVGSMTMSDETGTIVASETQTVIGLGTTGGGSGTPALDVTALRSVTPGTTTDVAISYSGLVSPSTLTMTLPPEMTPVLAVPSASLLPDGAQWRLTDTSGSVKLRVAVSSSAVAGSTLQIAASALDGSGTTYNGQASTIVRDGSTASGPTVSLTLPRTVTSGLTSDVSADYANLTGTGTLVLTLPDGMSEQSTTPNGATVSGNDVVFSNLASASGSVKVRTLVSSSLASGTSLPVSVTVSDGSGASASTASSTSVR
jgi:uncharacterized repeat protein (TIGR01451 family)